jgi:thymidine kinase
VIEFSEKASSEGIVVIISALDGTYLRTGFDNIIHLIPKAEKVKKLQAICKLCTANASFTFRTCLAEQIQLIGGVEAYVPLCRECYLIEHIKQEGEREKLIAKQQQCDASNSNSNDVETRNSSPNGDNQEELSSNDSSNEDSPEK